MIAIAKVTPKTKRCSNWQTGFLAMMPHIARNARRAFHYLDNEAQAEAVQEVLVSAMLAYFRLCQRGKVDLAYPSVLARFAIAQYRVGRRVSEKLNCKDVLSSYAQRRKNFRVESLRGREGTNGSWSEMLSEDKDAGPAETAGARIDFAEWFGSLSRRDRDIAEALSLGSTTSEVAKQFRVSLSRISQKRREFLHSWQKFHGESSA